MLQTSRSKESNDTLSNIPFEKREEMTRSRILPILQNKAIQQIPFLGLLMKKFTKNVFSEPTLKINFT